MIVTAVVRKPRRKKVDVYVEGELALTLGSELAVERGIRPGREISLGEIGKLAYEEERRGSLEAALRLLSYRQRSEQELRRRLREKGFAKPPVDESIARLRELGYVNDASFARFYTETQQAARPRSQRLLTVELRRKGVESSVAEVATLDVSDEEAAYDAASRRLRSLGGLEYDRFRERLGAFLTRRGFSYGIARQTIDRCWGELEAARQLAQEPAQP
jgi:regulatory protein